MRNRHDWQRISARCIKNSQNSFQYRQMIVEELRRFIDFDAYCCSVIDTQTLFSIGAVTEQSIEDVHQKIMTLEYATEDVHNYRNLVESGKCIGRLSDASSQSLRYREILVPYGFSDEIRAALMFQGQCYGFLTLFKKMENAQPIFQDDELEQVKILMSVMGEALKAFYHSIIEERLSTEAGESGIIILDKDYHILSISSKASQLLTHLRSNEGLLDWQLPKPIQAFCAKLQANRLNMQTSLLVPINNTGYITIQASLLKTTDSQQQIAIILNEASPKEMLTFLLTAYHLTPREKEVVVEIMKGVPTKIIAHNLGISSYTVQDHLKIIFQKIDVGDRNELVWKIFTRFN
ncbi:LuxR C-terminal-related transcriptional regulator [Lysinibacillus cavernae]|uniref:LuxR C-terminal-related transcriptional regulator n=1 Tax=Lysinibacillus cavernae TaxID=2666135 RepID=UPI0012D8CEBA|nr:LuxR C-terminal-related transcriptional regulator [Lysinibacillus cavernae]